MSHLYVPLAERATRALGRIIGALLFACLVGGCLGITGTLEDEEGEDIEAPPLSSADASGIGGESDASLGTNQLQEPHGNAADTSAPATSFTPAQINTAAETIKKYVEANRKLPGDVTIDSSKVTMPQFLQLAVHATLELDSGSGASVTLAGVEAPSAPTETITGGDLSKAEYLDLAQTITSAISSTAAAPDNAASKLGKIRYETLVYLYSKILAFYVANSRLPNYSSVEPWTMTTSDVQQVIKQIGQAEAKFRDVQNVCSNATCFVRLGYGDCWADSEWLYNELAKHKISARIMGYVNRGSGVWYRHAWVQINIGSGWNNWDYKGYHSQHFGDGCGCSSYVLIGPGKTSANILATGY